jgi:hypothetical protein
MLPYFTIRLFCRPVLWIRIHMVPHGCGCPGSGSGRYPKIIYWQIRQPVTVNMCTSYWMYPSQSESVDQIFVLTTAPAFPCLRSTGTENDIGLEETAEKINRRSLLDRKPVLWS